MAGAQFRAYISGSLSDLPREAQLKGFYERIGKLCEGKGIAAYVPHLMGTDPIENKDVTPSEVFHRDMLEVARSDLLIAYVGRPSLGVGAEIKQAYDTGTEVVLLWEIELSVSRLIRGCPAVRNTVIFTDFEDAVQKLSAVLDEWVRNRE